MKQHWFKCVWNVKNWKKNIKKGPTQALLKLENRNTWWNRTEGKPEFVGSTAGKTNFRVLTRFDFQFRNSNWINFDHWSNMDLNFQKVWILGWFQLLNDHFYDCIVDFVVICMCWFITLLTLDSDQLCSENNPLKFCFHYILRIPKIFFFWLECHLIIAQNIRLKCINLSLQRVLQG